MNKLFLTVVEFNIRKFFDKFSQYETIEIVDENVFIFNKMVINSSHVKTYKYNHTQLISFSKTAWGQKLYSRPYWLIQTSCTQKTEMNLVFITKTGYLLNIRFRMLFFKGDDLWSVGMMKQILCTGCPEKRGRLLCTKITGIGRFIPSLTSHWPTERGTQ